MIEKTLPEGVTIEPFLDRTKMVNNAIHTVKTNLMEGALIVVLILVFFLANLRAGLVVASRDPAGHALRDHHDEPVRRERQPDEPRRTGLRPDRGRRGDHRGGRAASLAWPAVMGSGPDSSTSNAWMRPCAVPRAA